MLKCWLCVCMIGRNFTKIGVNFGVVPNVWMFADEKGGGDHFFFK